MKNNKIPIILSIFLVVLAGVFFIFKLGVNNSGDGTAKNVEDSQNLSSESNAQNSLYLNNDYGFSFLKPKGFNVVADDQIDSYVVLVQPLEGQTGFQILITPFDEPDSAMTKERINKELPDVLVKNEKSVKAGSSEGLLFESNNEAFGGSSAEFWFLHSGNLYQFSGNLESKNVIEQVVASWKFN